MAVRFVGAVIYNFVITVPHFHIHIHVPIPPNPGRLGSQHWPIIVCFISILKALKLLKHHFRFQTEVIKVPSVYENLQRNIFPLARLHDSSKETHLFNNITLFLRNRFIVKVAVGDILPFLVSKIFFRNFRNFDSRSKGGSIVFYTGMAGVEQ